MGSTVFGRAHVFVNVYKAISHINKWKGYCD